jgi:nucleotide-binding universal stress UspA family protein
VPRFVAAGDLHRLPYMVMEYLQGHTLQHWLDASERPDEELIARLGTALAHAAHSLHQQNACHLDLKPANVLITHEDHAVLLDFGLSCHAHYPDLLAEEQRKAVGSPAWMAPEQVVGVRGDPRSDIFAIGVMLYELATGELPFGAPTTTGGCASACGWRPPRRASTAPDLAPWLQEIILRCLEPEAARRYPSAAHLALDLAHPDQVRITERGTAPRARRFAPTSSAGCGRRACTTSPARCLRAADRGDPHRHGGGAAQRRDRRHAVLAAPGGGALAGHPARRAAGLRDGALALGQQHQRQRAQRNHAAPPAPRPPAPVGPAAGPDRHPVSYHVLESSDVAQALVRYAEGNHVSMMILGAATHGLQTQRFIATVPMRVARDAPCTVILVKQSLPFAQLDRLTPSGTGDNRHMNLLPQHPTTSQPARPTPMRRSRPTR